MKASSRRGTVLALTLICAWHLLLRLPGMSLPLISDEGEYAYAARITARGGAPYRDAYLQKPPVVVLLYRLAFGLFGESQDAPRRLAVLFSWAAILGLYALAPPAWPWAARLAAPTAYASLSTQPVGDLGFAAQPEVFLNAWLVLAAAALWRARRRDAGALICGFFLGLAVMTKQTALWPAIVLAAAGCRERPRIRAAAALSLGAAGAAVPIVAWLARAGALSGFLEQAVSRNMDYATVLIAGGAVGGQLRWLAGTLAPLLLPGQGPAWALAVAGIALSPARPWEATVVAWLGAALVGTATGLFFFPHYWLLTLPPLALCAGLGLARLAPVRPRLAVWALIALGLWPAAAHGRSYLERDPVRLAKRLLHPNPVWEAVAAAHAARRLTSPGESIYVFGSEPQIYVYADRLCATRHIYVYPLTLFPRGPGEVEGELQRLSSDPPSLILYVNQPSSLLIASAAGEAFKEGVRRLLEQKYRYAGRVPISPNAAGTWENAATGGAADWTTEAILGFRPVRVGRASRRARS